MKRGKIPMNKMMTLPEASSFIRTGAVAFVAGDESLLAALPKGNWIGGTIPYFMTDDGGRFTRDQVFVTAMPDFVTEPTVKFYHEDELAGIPDGYKPNGFSYIVIPALTCVHQTFAHDCSTWPGVFNRPLLGWIAGTDVKDIGAVSPKVFNGQTGESSASKAAVMHMDLPKNRFAQVDILNVFKQGSGDTITFPASGFEAGECFINGEKQNLAAYIAKHKIDTHLPLVADYMGAMINVSFQSVDAAAGTVKFYAPVFPGVEYKIAAPVSNYEAEFQAEMKKKDIHPVFSCNCILNYLYANLEGKKTGHIVGPITFGEIAYMLLNQTLVYLTFETK
jgi:hypothetical protein